MKNIKFKAKVALGISGVALMGITEELVNGFGCVENDLKECGVDNWWYWLDEKPKEPGLYVVEGEALVSEDSCEYILITFGGIVTFEPEFDTESTEFGGMVKSPDGEWMKHCDILDT